MNNKKAAEFQGEPKVDMEESLINLNDSYLNYKTVVTGFGERRVTFFNDLSTLKARAEKSTAANVVKAIEANEEQRWSWARIHKMDGSARNGKGLTKVISPNSNEIMVERVDTEGMENIYLNENVSEFTQAISILCTISPLRDNLGFLGTGQAALYIMIGTSHQLE